MVTHTSHVTIHSYLSLCKLCLNSEQPLIHSRTIDQVEFVDRVQRVSWLVHTDRYENDHDVVKLLRLLRFIYTE